MPNTDTVTPTTSTVRETRAKNKLATTTTTVGNPSAPANTKETIATTAVITNSDRTTFTTAKQRSNSVSSKKATTTTTASIAKDVVITASSSPASACDADVSFQKLFSAFADEISQIRRHFQDQVDEMLCKLANFTDEFSQKFSLISNSIVTLDQRIAALEQQRAAHEAVINDIPQNSDLNQRIDALERQRIAEEVVVNNIPHTSGENLTDLFDSLLSNVNITVPRDSVKCIYRIKGNTAVGNKRDCSIIIKFTSALYKNTFLKDLAYKCRELKRGMCLRDVDMHSPHPSTSMKISLRGIM